MSDFKEFEFESQANYTFIEEIGRGGMGIVYLAARNSGSVVDYVVLKTLKSLHESDENSLQQEANLAAQLRHENIVKTYGLERIPLSSLPSAFLQNLGALSYVRDIENNFPKVRRLNFRSPQIDEHRGSIIPASSSEANALLLLVMDYIDGASLHSLHYGHIEQSLLMPVPFGAFIISRIARALAYAHNYLIHRDISPENILVNTQGTCKLSDFGIAIATHHKPDYWAGKLGYMAPEQMLHEPIDERIDIFALGSVAYQILTGIPLVYVPNELPLETQVNRIMEQLRNKVLPPHKVCHDIPESLSDIIMKMLALTPNQRYQRASSIASDLEKRFLYAKGYGPTNNSLATYMSIYENRFSMYNEEQLEQLSFLKNESGEIQLKRYINRSNYTPEGLKLLETRKHDKIYQKLYGQSSATSTSGEVIATNREIRSPHIKVKYLDNVLESFSIQNKPIILGSGQENDIVLQDATLEPKHCQIQKADESVFLTMLSGKEVLVNNKIVVEKELREGDKIKIGSHFLFFIQQTPSVEISNDSILSLTQKINTFDLLANQNFALKFSCNPTNYTQIAKICEQILAKTNLSELKLGVIPSALLEALQMLKTGNENATFTLQVLRTPVRIIFICSGCTMTGYRRLLNTFLNHRQRLGLELAQRELSSELKGTDISIAEELLTSSVTKDHSSLKKAVTEQEIVESDDMEALIDPTMLAATMIVQSFDRIEFKSDSVKVEFAVYL